MCLSRRRLPRRHCVVPAGESLFTVEEAFSIPMRDLMHDFARPLIPNALRVCVCMRVRVRLVRTQRYTHRLCYKKKINR